MSATFEKVGTGNQVLYGPRKLLLCGFPAEAQPKFHAVLQAAGLATLPLVWVGAAAAAQPVGDLMALPGGSGEGVASDLPRAIVMGGITEKEMHLLMGTCRQAGMRPPLWAVVTPTSEQWPLAALLEELSAEREALQQKP
jgi:hypothetical protein